MSSGGQSLPMRLESVFGPIREGWAVPAIGTIEAGVQVVSFAGTRWTPPVLATLGLSDHILTQRHSQRGIRIELVCPEGTDRMLLVRLLMMVSQRMIQSHDAVLRGDWLNISGLSSDWFGFYMTLPIFINEVDHAVQAGNETVNLVWAIPIKQAEACFIDRSGWQAWEDVLEENFDKLSDPCRASFIGTDAAS